MSINIENLTALERVAIRDALELGSASLSAAADFSSSSLNGASLVNVSAGSQTLTMLQSAAGLIVFTGTLAQDTTITSLVAQRRFENRTSGTFILRVAVGQKIVRLPRHELIEIT